MKHKRQKIDRSIGNQQQGFTLVEFMVASVLGLVVIAGAGSLYSYTKRLNDMGMARVAMLQDLRSAATMIGQDSRSAGVFGCASLGRRHDPDATNAEIGLHDQLVQEVDANGQPVLDNDGEPKLITQPIANQAAKLSTLDSTPPAAGVRRFAYDDPDAASIWQSFAFTPVKDSDVLVFYYGEGSLSFNSAKSSATKVHFNTDEKHPNQVVSQVLTGAKSGSGGKGGYVVAAGCNDLVIAKTDGKHAADTFEVNVPTTAVGTASGTLTGSGVVTAASGIKAHGDMILQRYKAVAYAVGDIDGEPTSLYRFEFGNNGDDWSAPQQLAKNVKNMEADYLFVTDCESGMVASSGGSAGTARDDLNSQTFEIQKASVSEGGSAYKDAKDRFYGPSSIHLTLTYDFPKIRGGSVETGGTDQKFNITAVVRGGNVCASRKIVPF